MNIHNTDITMRHLQILREVMRAGSERLAAQILRVTQPAVSQKIKQLEMLIGFPLFRRENNRLIPTEKAWTLLKSVDSAFAEFERLGKSISSLKSTDTCSIGIAAPAIFSLDYLPRAIRKMRNGNRSLLIQLKSGGYQEVADHVLHGHSDLGICRLPLDERFFEWTPLGTARNVCLFPPDHPFARKDRITSADLVGEPLIDIDPQYAAHQMSLSALRYLGAEPEIVVEYDANGHDAGFVAAGIGVSITNEIIARQYGALGLLFRPFEPGAIYHYVVCWQRDRILNDMLLRAKDELVSTFHK